MFETLVSSLLDGYLSPYVDNFDASKLKIGYGAVVLKDLALRVDAFKVRFVRGSLVSLFPRVPTPDRGELIAGGNGAPGEST